MTLRYGIIAAVAFGWAVTLPTMATAAGKRHAVKSYNFTFAADTLGHAPANSVPFGGTWQVIPDSAGIAADSSSHDTTAVVPRVLRQSEDQDGLKFHYIQFPKPALDNIIVSVRFRIISGEIDPSAGVMFQVDPKGRNGYIVRASAESGQLAVHYFLSGRRRDLRVAKIEKPEPNTWHTLEVEHVGTVMIVRYDGVETIRIREERYSHGCLGLWSEEDTVVDFEGLKVAIR